MQITLAYPYDGHSPDETIEVADGTGRQMIHDGLARLPAHPDEATLAAVVPADETRTVAELKAAAEAAGIDLAGATRKAEIAAVIAVADSTQMTSTAPPASGATEET